MISGVSAVTGKVTRPRVLNYVQGTQPTGGTKEQPQQLSYLNPVDYRGYSIHKEFGPDIISNNTDEHYVLTLYPSKSNREKQYRGLSQSDLEQYGYWESNTPLEKMIPIN